MIAMMVEKGTLLLDYQDTCKNFPWGNTVSNLSFCVTAGWLKDEFEVQMHSSANDSDCCGMQLNLI